MATRLDAIRKVRLERLASLKKLGINPYPSKLDKKTEPVAAARKKLEKMVSVAGRIWGWREHGNVIFADLKDETGQIQLFLQKKSLGDKYKILKLLDVGDFLLVSGEVIKTHAGEISIRVAYFQLLTKSIRPIPSTWYGLKDVEERYRQRYVDLLLNEDIRKVFEMRTKIVKGLRQYMDENGFVEVETPVLQPIYGGASAEPFVTHHNALDIDLYLRISDELYLKRLIVGGYQKVYEIGHVFRNEGVDRAHNPEFTMMEFYWAYANYEDLMKFSEEMLTRVIRSVTETLKIKYGKEVLNFTAPWPRKSYRELLMRELDIDINKADSEEKLKTEIKKRRLGIDLKDVIGYGAMCDKLYKEYIRPKIIQPTFVTDYPAAMIALAKKKEDDETKIASFQLLVNGYELIKAYNELNDPVDQKERWSEEEKLGKKGLAEHMVVDEDYVRALEYGMPPTAGWGLGVDRLAAILTNQHTIKETILFPTMRPEK